MKSLHLQKCFAELENGECAVLKYDECIGAEKCSFYKTKKQFTEQEMLAKKKWEQRKKEIINEE